jgi:hypothetical protein
LHPIGRIIGVIGGDGWGQGVYSRRWSSFDIGGDLLALLLFFIRVTENNDVAISRRPKKLMVEFGEESSGEHFITRNVGEAFLLVGRKIHHRDILGRPVMLSSEGLLCSRTGEDGLHEGTSGGDIGGNRDSNGDGGGVEAPLDEDEELLLEEHERLMPLVSSTVNKWKGREKPLEEKVKKYWMDSVTRWKEYL